MAQPRSLATSTPDRCSRVNQLLLPRLTEDDPVGGELSLQAVEAVYGSCGTWRSTRCSPPAPRSRRRTTAASSRVPCLRTALQRPVRHRGRHPQLAPQPLVDQLAHQLPQLGVRGVDASPRLQRRCLQESRVVPLERIDDPVRRTGRTDRLDEEIVELVAVHEVCEVRRRLPERHQVRAADGARQRIDRPGTAVRRSRGRAWCAGPQPPSHPGRHSPPRARCAPSRPARSLPPHASPAPRVPPAPALRPPRAAAPLRSAITAPGSPRRGSTCQ